jgi:hypothetical protein
LSNITLGFNETEITHDFDISDLYIFIDEKDCGEVKCDLLKDDCLTPLDSSSHVSMAETYPFKVTAKRNIAEGYNFETCIRCKDAPGVS